MIKQINGNLLDFPDGINVLVHQANCMCIMGGGIARQIASRYPQAKEADNNTEKGDYGKLGNLSVAKLDNGNLIVNLYGQYNISSTERMTDYNALANGFLRLRKLIQESKTPEKYVIGIPYNIGCGLGGGSWRIVYAIISDIFEDSSVQVVIVKLEK